MGNLNRLTEAFANSLDEADPLSKFRDRFFVPPDTVYLDGNSLGLLSTDAEVSMLGAIEAWKVWGVRGWTEAEPKWFTLAESVSARMAKLVGADPKSVILTGTTTINLHQMIGTFYRPEGRRRKIVATALDFPSDIHALKSQIRIHGGASDQDLVLVPSRDGRTIDEADIERVMSDEVALVLLPSVLYRSGQLLDIPRLTAAAHACGAVIGFDCAHSVGALPHAFDAWDIDFAVWCSYKYLNAGPGAVGALYVNRRHFEREPSMAGWWGVRKDQQFEMAHDWVGAGHAGAFQISTVPVISAAALEGALTVTEEAGIGAIRAKSLAQTDYLMDLITESGLGEPRFGYQTGTPREHNRRGGHVAVEHEHAAGISLALKARGVVVDFRPPNVIRLAPVALYTSFHDLWQAVEALELIVEEEEYLGMTSADAVT